MGLCQAQEILNSDKFFDDLVLVVGDGDFVALPGLAVDNNISCYGAADDLRFGQRLVFSDLVKLLLEFSAEVYCVFCHNGLLYTFLPSI